MNPYYKGIRIGAGKVNRLLIWILLLVDLGHLRARESPEVKPTPTACIKTNGTKVILLGTGTPVANPYRFGPAVAVLVKKKIFLVDFGPGVVHRAARALKQFCSRLQVKDIHHAFVTHLHSDHTAGYANLILTPWVLGRQVPLQVIGPPGISTMTESLLEAYREDIQARKASERIVSNEGIRVLAQDAKPGQVYQDGQVRVIAFPVRHGRWKHAYGFRFETPGRTIVISGDTAPSESVVEHCNGCDVLIHEVYSEAGFALREPNWQAYLRKYHTSTHELANLAQKAKPRLLVLYHQLQLGFKRKQILKELKKKYRGRIIYGDDLMVL